MVLGQVVSWPQVFKLRCERGEGVSLISFAVVLVSMSFAWVHALMIGDRITVVAVPLALVPNALIAGALIRRRVTGREPRAVARGACGRPVERGPNDPLPALVPERALAREV